LGRTACTEPQCPYKGDLYLYYLDYTLVKKIKSPVEILELENKITI